MGIEYDTERHFVSHPRLLKPLVINCNHPEANNVTTTIQKPPSINSNHSAASKNY